MKQVFIPPDFFLYEFKTYLSEQNRFRENLVQSERGLRLKIEIDLYLNQDSNIYF